MVIAILHPQRTRRTPHFTAKHLNKGAETLVPQIKGDVGDRFALTEPGDRLLRR